MSDRYGVVFVAILNEWHVIDTHGPEVVNSYHRDAKDRADEVAVGLNETEQES